MQAWKMVSEGFEVLDLGIFTFPPLVAILCLLRNRSHLLVVGTLMTDRRRM